MTAHSAFKQSHSNSLNDGSVHNEDVNSCEQNEHLTVVNSILVSSMFNFDFFITL